MSSIQFQTPKPIEPAKLIAILIIFAIACMCIASLIGCRTVQKAQSIIKKDIDSTVTIEHDSSTVENYYNWEDYFSSDSIAVHIEFKDSSKPMVKPQHPHSFIDNLMQLANSGNVKVLDITAKKLKDSSHLIATNLVATKNDDTTIHKTDQTKTKVSTKDVKSNTALWIVIGVVLIFLGYGGYLYKTANNTVGVASKAVDAVSGIEKQIKGL